MKYESTPKEQHYILSLENGSLMSFTAENDFTAICVAEQLGGEHGYCIEKEENEALVMPEKSGYDLRIGHCVLEDMMVVKYNKVYNEDIVEYEMAMPYEMMTEFFSIHWDLIEVRSYTPDDENLIFPRIVNELIEETNELERQKRIANKREERGLAHKKY